MTRPIKLNKNDVAFLQQNLDLSKFSRLTLDDEDLDVAPNDVDNILDALGHLLMTAGTDEEGELNEVGHRIEGLIDTFNRSKWG